MLRKHQRLLLGGLLERLALGDLNKNTDMKSVKFYITFGFNLHICLAELVMSIRYSNR
jgi:hypothetical protein